MKDIQLEARLKGEKLSVNGQEMSLDSSLFSARILKISDSNGSENSEPEGEYPVALELGYKNNREGFIYDEATDIHSYLQRQGLDDDRIQVNPSEEGEYPVINLVGDIRARVFD
jgi:hypothetical protein